MAGNKFDAAIIRGVTMKSVSYTHLDVYKRQAMENIMPQLEVKARRVGGATYQVPMEDVYKRQKIG